MTSVVDNPSSVQGANWAIFSSLHSSLSPLPSSLFPLPSSLFLPSLQVSHLVPEDFWLGYGDVVPGVSRFDAQGQLTRLLARTVSSLANPILTPSLPVSLAEISLLLPPNMMEAMGPRAGAGGVQVRPDEAARPEGGG